MKRPPGEPVRRPLALPEIRALRELRRALSFGGLTPSHRRSPEDCARIGAFRVLQELLHLLDQFRRRVEQGERVRLVEREHIRESGRLLIELVIEARP
jgi:hypothetical protein